MISVGKLTSSHLNWEQDVLDNKMSFDYFLSYEKIKSNTNLIMDKLSLSGFCIINGIKDINDSESIIKIFDNNFGNRLRQTNLDETKEFFVMPRENIAPQDTPRKGLYSLLSKDEAQPLHTDFAFNGIEPNFVILQCIKASPKGGYSLMLKTEELENYLLSKYGDLVNLLYEENAITYIKAFRGITKKIFFKNSLNKTNISFNIFAQILKGKTKNHEMLINDLIRYTMNLNNLIRYKLKDNEILVLNNGLIMHGRTAFEGDRLLKRIWYNEKK